VSKRRGGLHWSSKTPIRILKYKVKRDEYLGVIDGLVFGDDPKQGYVKDNFFIHPEMK
jgi:predicted Zn-dependent protease